MRKVTIDLNNINRSTIFENYVRQGENLATEVEFILSPEFVGYKYLMLFQLNDKTPVTTTALTPKDNKVSYVISNAVTNEAGMLRVELHAYDTKTNALIKTAYVNIRVAQSINGNTKVMPESYVPWYIEAVKQASIATEEASKLANYNTEMNQRIDNLVSGLTQDSEVIDARSSATKGKTFDSLDARLEEAEQDLIANKQQTDVKIAKVDKELTNLQRTLAQVNINQEAKQKVSGYGVVSLPKNAANGQVSSSVKGRTLKNELNYNRDTWEEWQNKGSAIVSNKYLTVDNNDIDISLEIPTNVRPSTKYGILVNVRNNTRTTTTALCVPSSGNYPFPTSLQISAGTIGNFKSVQTTNSSFAISSNYRMLITANTGRIEFGDIRIFELPTGSEIENDFNTMTADQLAIKYPYISGDSVKSTDSASRLKSVGKNLFDKNSKTIKDGYFLDNNGGLSASSVDFTDEKYYLCTELITLSSNLISTSLRIAWYDENKNFISRNVTATNSYLSPLVPAGAKYFRISGNLEQKDSMQIEKGTVATPYEPYTESTQYIQAKDSQGKITELRSLPNGTKDEIRVGEGKFIKRVSEYKVKSDENLIFAALTNVDVYRVVLSDNAPFNTDDTQKLVVEGRQLVPFANRDNVDNIGKYYTTSGTNSNCVFFVFAKGTTLSQVREQLVGTTLTYQLAEPIITPIETSGTLLSYPSGTVYVENVIADAGVYTDKFTILQQDLPIKEIEKISKVDFMTGVETELNVSQAVIAADKLSFTHPDLVNGDIVFTTYFYDVESTQGETTVTYYDSRYVIKDTANEKFYQWKITATNGQPNIELVEV